MNNVGRTISDGVFSVVRFGKILLCALEWSHLEVFLIFQLHTVKKTEFNYHLSGAPCHKLRSNSK